MNRYILFFNTIKYLKPIQIYYRVFYLIRSKFRRIVGFQYKFLKNSNSNILKLDRSIESTSIYKNGEFRFLNISKRFENSIDWNYNGYGKLWTYNLTYFDFLSQKEDKFLIENFIDNIESINDGLEPFPISLRGVNWIKFLTKYKIRDKKIDSSLYAQYYILLDNLEYHLLGNHLLENGFSLLFGAYYFRDEELYIRAKKILLTQLDEQILNDGGHFELSPMYHQIMLFRLLDSINLVKNSNWKDRELLEFLSKKAEIMLGWLESISYLDGNIPMFNDSAKDIAPTTNELIDYAIRLRVNTVYIKLSDSGYRKISNSRYESIIDIGSIKADYIAGHTHADIFNFELRMNGKEFIIDRGVTTYNSGKQRNIERSTYGHNCVEINGKSQSEVWDSFRVGNRAKVIDIKESKYIIEATHNGYKDILHTRKWTFEKDRVIIEDKLNKTADAVARLYFHFDISQEYILEHLNISSDSYRFGKYHLSIGFNKTKLSNFIEIPFSKSLKIVIDIV